MQHKHIHTTDTLSAAYHATQYKELKIILLLCEHNKSMDLQHNYAGTTDIKINQLHMGNYATLHCVPSINRSLFFGD